MMYRRIYNIITLFIVNIYHIVVVKALLTPFIWMLIFFTPLWTEAQQFLNGSFETTNYTRCTFGLSNSGLTAHVPASGRIWHPARF